MKKLVAVATAFAAVVAALVLARPVLAASLDDATILAIFDQANATDISIGRLGVKYGASDDVRALARMVVADHVAVQQMGRDLARTLTVQPVPPENDMSVAEQAKAIATLQGKRGAEFDRAYLRHEVTFHQGVIDAVKTTLLPAATSSEVKKLLRDVLPGLEAHLAATQAAARKHGVM